MPKTKFCPECGGVVKPTAKKCPQCGLPLREQNGRQKRWFWLGAGAVLLAGAAVLGIFFLRPAGPEVPPDSTPASVLISSDHGRQLLTRQITALIQPDSALEIQRLVDSEDMAAASLTQAVSARYETAAEVTLYEDETGRLFEAVKTHYYSAFDGSEYNRSELKAEYNQPAEGQSDLQFVLSCRGPEETKEAILEETVQWSDAEVSWKPAADAQSSDLTERAFTQLCVNPDLAGIFFDPELDNDLVLDEKTDGDYVTVTLGQDGLDELGEMYRMNLVRRYLNNYNMEIDPIYVINSARAEYRLGKDEIVMDIYVGGTADLSEEQFPVSDHYHLVLRAVPAAKRSQQLMHQLEQLAEQPEEACAENASDCQTTIAVKY